MVLIAVLSVTVAESSAAAGRPQALGDHATTQEYNRALGVQCSHCHAAGDPLDTSKPTFDFARRMARMLRGLNEGPLRALEGITCWSCHRGQPIPPRLPTSRWEQIEALNAATFASAREGLGLTMSVYAASLGVQCSHCHVPGAWRAGSKRPHALVATMATVFELIPAYFDRSVRVPRTQCYMCHQGSVSVERSPK